MNVSVDTYILRSHFRLMSFKTTLMLYIYMYLKMLISSLVEDFIFLFDELVNQGYESVSF